MDRLIFATGNQNKLKEIKEIFADLPFEIVSMKDAGIISDPDENGTTFEDNALIKARDVWEKCNETVMSDNSVLEIDYLGKEPGVHSARFMGHDTSYDLKNAELLRRLEGVPFEKRTARFVCACALILPDGTEHVVRETMEGHIADSPSGNNGFGYDPIFIPDGYDVTSADISPEEKNQISHRGKALRKMYQFLSSCK